MNRNTRFLLIILMALGFVLSACGGNAVNAPAVEEPAVEEPAVEEPAAEEMEEPAEEEMEEPVAEEMEEPAEEEMEEEPMAEAADLDMAFTSFLSTMEAYNTVGLEDANLALIEDPAPFLLDVREVSEAEEKGHIEGAVLIPLRELGQNLDKLPSFDTPIITYCGSGWRATIAMTALETLGWTDVTVLKGGSFSGWVEAGYPSVDGVPPEAEVTNAAQPDAAAVAEMDQMLSNLPQGWGVTTPDDLNLELVENPDLILIDVRRQEELDEKGTIDAPNLIHIPIEQFVEMQDMWPADQEAEIVVYCGSGHRSTIGMSILNTYGYSNVSSLKGGFGGWAEAGYATVGGSAPADSGMAEATILDEPFNSFLSSMEAYNTIGLEDANLALIEDPAPFLLDVREFAEAEEKGHIEGAVMIPLREVGQNLDKLPSFDTPMIIYCGSGWRATIAMTALEALGWNDIKVLKGGSFSGWVEAGYPAVEGVPPVAEALNAADPDPALAAEMDAMLSNVPDGFGGVDIDVVNTELIENPDLILVDVRRQEELDANGVIDAPNLIHIPLEEFVADMEMWPADQDATIVVYCGSGHRSTIGMSILWSYGYEDVRSMKGGFGAWAGAGFPVVGGGEESDAGSAVADLDTAFADFLAGMEAYNTIGLEDANLALIEDPAPFLLDVREFAEAEEKGHIEGAVMIPLREVGQNLDKLPSFDTPMIIYCGSGWRATIAMTALEALGWNDIKVLKGGSFSGWVEAGYPAVEGVPPEAEALNAADPDPALAAEMDAMLSNVPDGFGGVDIDVVNTELIENPDLILVDVRRQEELDANGVIDAPNLVHIPLEEFVADMEMWPADQDATIVVYCGSGHRSTIGMSILWSYGYEDVRSMKGGFGAWAEEGFPVAEYAAP